MRASVVVGLTLVAVAAVGSACHHDDTVVVTPSALPLPSVTITTGNNTPPTQPTATATATATTTAAPTPTGGPATPVSPSMADAAGPVLDQMAKSDAKGMQPEGSAFAGQFQEGQTLEQTFNATPGKCYTAFASGIGTITQLDLTAMTVSPSPMIPALTVAQSNSTGPTATIGGAGNCVKYPLPIGGPFKIVIKATHGSGIAVGRVYSK